ncbi:MAG: hypothetical protein ABJ360_05380 [Roseobacter sp.]
MQILPDLSPIRTLAMITGVATIAACAPESGKGQFYREAGVQVDQGEFGNATLHNQLVQTCRTNRSGSGKLGSHTRDPLVVLDPSSTPKRQVYRVHCNGQLDGKYAQVIYRDYVGSAVESASIEAADSE